MASSARRPAAAWLGAAAVAALVALPATAQREARPADPDEPAVGAWRGTLAVREDQQVPLVLSLVRRGDALVGAVNIGGARETPIDRVTVEGARVTIETGADSKLGRVAFAADLTVDGNSLDGVGELSLGPLPVAVSIELRRQRRADVLQPTVEQNAAYFAGDWTFEYFGAEMPPVSPGSRSGRASFTAPGPTSVVGEIEGEIEGEPYRESWSMTFDPDTNMLAVIERRDGGTELLSVANWQTPLAIRFTTSPVRDGDHEYRVRRLVQIVSETSFEITEEVSIDGGRFLRLGHAGFEKAP